MNGTLPMSFLAQMTWPQWILAFLLIAVCCLLMIVILLQRGRGGGLTGAFGGAGGTAAFGAKTGDVFTWITVVVAAVFVLLAVVANYAFDQAATAAVVAPVPDEIPGVETVIPPSTRPVAVPPPSGGGELPPTGDDTTAPSAPGERDESEPSNDGAKPPGTTPG
jgi:preprotein translocase subunit SecG